jgi:predicted metal-dependent hydrolase
MTVAQLVMELEWRFRAVKRETVRTAAQRLAVTGALESRTAVMTRTLPESPRWGVAGEAFGSQCDRIAEWRVA